MIRAFGRTATLRHSGMAIRCGPLVCNSARLPDATAVKRVRRQFAEPRLVVAGKSSGWPKPNAFATVATDPPWSMFSAVCVSRASACRL